MVESILDKKLSGVDNLSFNPVDLGMAPLPLNVLIPGTKIPADLFLAGFSREKDRVEMIPATSKGEIFQVEWRENLIRAGQKKVYVSMDETPALTAYFGEYTKKIMDNPKTTRKEKSAFVHEMASFNLRLLFGSDLSQGAMNKAVNSTSSAIDMMLRDNQILTRLAELLKTDYTVYSHSVNVSMLAMGFSRFMKQTEGQVRTLGLGGMLMEVGLAKIEIKMKDKPDESEQTRKSLYRNHTRYGYDLLKMISAVPYDVLMIVLDHHENIDGSGYPNGKKGDSIPYPAQVIRVIDTYDTLTSPSSDREAYAPLEAGHYLKEFSGTKFCQSIVTSFLRFMGSPYFTN